MIQITFHLFNFVVLNEAVIRFKNMPAIPIRFLLESVIVDVALWGRDKAAPV